MAVVARTGPDSRVLHEKMITHAGASYERATLERSDSEGNLRARPRKTSPSRDTPPDLLMAESPPPGGLSAFNGAITYSHGPQDALWTDGIVERMEAHLERFVPGSTVFFRPLPKLSRCSTPICAAALGGAGSFAFARCQGARFAAAFGRS
jgi:hypothetical protein